VVSKSAALPSHIVVKKTHCADFFFWKGTQPLQGSFAEEPYFCRVPLQKNLTSTRACKSVPHFNTLQHTATQCTALQHPATQRNTEQYATTPYDTLQHPAAPCSTLQHPATHTSSRAYTSLLPSMNISRFGGSCGWYISFLMNEH